MGPDKATLSFGDHSLLSRIVRHIETICRPVIVVARDPAQYPNCGARVIADRWPDAGPLGGLHAGLLAAETPYAAAVACDLPFIEPPSSLASSAAPLDGMPSCRG